MSMAVQVIETRPQAFEGKVGVTTGWPFRTAVTNCDKADDIRRKERLRVEANCKSNSSARIA